MNMVVYVRNHDLLYSYLRSLHTHTHTHFILKPQDSFGEFNYFFLDLQKVQEIIKKTPSDLTYGKVFGGTLNIFMLSLFPEMETFRSELLTGH